MIRPLVPLVVALLAFSAWPASADDLSACRSHDPRTAIEACTRLIEADRAGTDLGAADLLEAVSLRARARFTRHRYAGAIVDCDRAIALAPGDAALRLLRGNIAYEVKDYAGAIGHYTGALARDPTLGSAYAGRGGARTYEGDHDGALADFEAAMANGSDNAWTYNGRGNALRAAGDLERAHADYLHATELDPAKVDAWLNIGDVRLIRGDDEGAREAYQRAVDLDVDDRVDAKNAATGLGEALARLGRPDEAFASYERGMARATPREITEGQGYLAATGHYSGPVNGLYDDATRAALQACIADPAC